jgi:hypothetical protein
MPTNRKFPSKSQQRPAGREGTVMHNAVTL